MRWAWRWGADGCGAPARYIKIEEATGRTAEQAADELAAEFPPPGFNIERTLIGVDGEEAVVLDNMSGQDTNRQVVMVHNGACTG